MKVTENQVEACETTLETVRALIEYAEENESPFVLDRLRVLEAYLDGLYPTLAMIHVGQQDDGD